MEFEDVWANIVCHVGEEFYTKTGLSFMYKMVGNNVYRIGQTILCQSQL